MDNFGSDNAKQDQYDPEQVLHPLAEVMIIARKGFSKCAKRDDGHGETAEQDYQKVIEKRLFMSGNGVKKQLYLILHELNQKPRSILQGFIAKPNG